MTKRIVSGIFILTALGALGVILAGALTSGEQLIVRFLTAVIVAALGLYVISDLRLQADDQASRRRLHQPFGAVGELPANSTAAFMASVTSQRGPDLVDLDAGDSDGVTVGQSDDEESLADAEEADAREIDTVTGEPVTGEPDLVESAVTVGPVSEAAVVGNDDVDSQGDTTATAFSFFAKDSSTNGASSNGSASGYSASNGSEPDEHTDSDLTTDEQPAISPLPEGDERSDVAAADDSVAEYSVAEYSVVEGRATAAEEADPGQMNGAQDYEITHTEPLNSTDKEAIAAGEFSDSSEHAWPVSANYEPNGAASDDIAIAHGSGGGDDGSSDEARSSSSDFDENLDNIDPTEAVANGLVPSGTQVEAADYVDAPLAPIIDLREVHSVHTAGSVDHAIRAGEMEVITTLIEQGMLSTQGAITDRDVRTMVYVAFTSNELRKLLLAGGTPDGPNQGLDLGPVELFDESLHGPVPKTVYQGKGLLSGSVKPQLNPAKDEERQRQLG